MESISSTNPTALLSATSSLSLVEGGVEMTGKVVGEEARSSLGVLRSYDSCETNKEIFLLMCALLVVLDDAFMTDI